MSVDGEKQITSSHATQTKRLHPLSCHPAGEWAMAGCGWLGGVTYVHAMAECGCLGDVAYFHAKVTNFTRNLVHV
jgi:hypothetical protein